MTANPTFFMVMKDFLKDLMKESQFLLSSPHSTCKAVNSNIVGGDRQDGISLNKESSRVAMSNLKHKELACVAFSMGRLYIS